MLAGPLFNLLIVSDKFINILHKINHANVTYIYFRTNTHVHEDIFKDL